MSILSHTPSPPYTLNSAYQHYQTYPSHYPQAAYPAHYQAYAPPVGTTQRPATTGSASAATNNNVDTSDLSTLNDALGSAGVDLRVRPHYYLFPCLYKKKTTQAEEETLQRTHDQSQPGFRASDDRRKKQPANPNFDIRFLGQTMKTVGTSHKVNRVPDDAINYLALALRARLQDLITSMIATAKHRTSTQFDRPASLHQDGHPMWSIVVRSDVAKQLAAIEKAEREEETRIRRERKERAEFAAAHAAALAAQANAAGGVPLGAGGLRDDDEGGTKKKRKKEGPGVAARNMSEDVRKKMSNAVATQAAGLGGRYAWMNAATLNTPIPPKPKLTATAASAAATATPTAGSATPGTSTAATTAAAASASTSSWATPYIPTKPKQAHPPQEEDARLAITIRDAMFVIENDQGHGGGRGAARTWV